MKRFSFLVLLLLPLSLFAQDKRILQFSGLVMTSDSLRAIPLVNIYSKTSGTGTFTDWKGFFSLVAREGDTIIFSAIGFETAEAVIPDSLPEDRYSMVQLMTGDTIFLAETVIFPWPSREDFRETFLYADIPADQYEIAAKNLKGKNSRNWAKHMAMMPMPTRITIPSRSPENCIMPDRIHPSGSLMCLRGKPSLRPGNVAISKTTNAAENACGSSHRSCPC